MRKARANMIENQIRAGGVHLQSVFDSLDAVRREEFVPVSCRNYAFADMEIPLPYGQNMLTPLTEALVLQAVAPARNDTVLEIGAGSGYMAALLAHKTRHVTTVEIEPGLKEIAANNLVRTGTKNVRVLCENGFSIERYAPDRLFDIIVFSGAVSAIPEVFKNRLSVNGRMVVFYERGSFVQTLLLQKNSAFDLDIKILFETSVKPLREQLHHSHFCF